VGILVPMQVTEDFSDENNETFCPQTPSKPPFPVIESEPNMSTAEETYCNDAMEYSSVS
jgi:hypothetical protein